MDITVETTVKAPIEAVWEAWTTPGAITQWNFASEDWHCPVAELDLRPGGRFNHRMEEREGAGGFDLEGEFTRVDHMRRIDFVLDDGRKVSVEFRETPEGVHVSETFEAENTFSPELQRDGWQAILDNFRRYAEMNQ